MYCDDLPNEYRVGGHVLGYVTAVGNTEIIVDIGTMHTGYAVLSDLTDDPTKKPCDIVKVGDEKDFIILKINNAERIVLLRSAELQKHRMEKREARPSQTDKLVLQIREGLSSMKGEIVSDIVSGVSAELRDIIIAQNDEIRRLNECIVRLEDMLISIMEK